ncbi:hypothetical protein EGYY_02840 [Eggerthella sp. YY7918]|nr:hypothetical protein EGYY_02840 [Eggerthella sp. YY7918]
MRVKKGAPGGKNVRKQGFFFYFFLKILKNSKKLEESSYRAFQSPLPIYIKVPKKMSF